MAHPFQEQLGESHQLGIAAHKVVVNLYLWLLGAFLVCCHVQKSIVVESLLSSTTIRRGVKQIAIKNVMLCHTYVSLKVNKKLAPVVVKEKRMLAERIRVWKLPMLLEVKSAWICLNMICEKQCVQQILSA